MATSTFYEKIIIEEEAAAILVDGLNGTKLPRPPVPENIKWKGDEGSLIHYRTNLRRSSQAPTQQN